MTSADTLEVVTGNTKSLELRAALATLKFLREFCRHYFPDDRAESKTGVRQTEAAQVIGITQTHLSDILNEKRKPGINVVAGLARATGASFEDILGLRPSTRPKYPFSLMTPDVHRGAAAAAEADSRAHDRPSGIDRAASPSVKPPRR